MGQQPATSHSTGPGSRHMHIHRMGWLRQEMMAGATVQCRRYTYTYTMHVERCWMLVGLAWLAGLAGWRPIICAVLTPHSLTVQLSVWILWSPRPAGITMRPS